MRWIMDLENWRIYTAGVYALVMDLENWCIYDGGVYAPDNGP